VPKLRVGISDILDTRPLSWGFLKGHHADLFVPQSHPSALVGQLLGRGEIEVGLLPAIDAARLAGEALPGLTILPDLAVAAPASCRSVVVLARRPIEELDRIVAGREARTTRAALSILLAERYADPPELVDRESTATLVGPLADPATGMLLVGGPGFAAERDGFEVLDVAALWRQHTGLPLVLGFWCVRPDIHLPDLPFYFISSLRYGLQSLGTIAREAAAELGLDSSEIQSYFRDDLSFFLRPEEVQGLAELYRRAHAHGLLPSRLEPTFWEGPEG
jgi:predicted solute-binding protein